MVSDVTEISRCLNLRQSKKHVVFCFVQKKNSSSEIKTAKNGTWGPFLMNDFWQNIKMLLSLKRLKIFCCCLFYYKDINEIMKVKFSIWKYAPKSSRCCHSKFFVKKRNFFFKNTNLKNYKFFTGDHHHTVLHSLKRRVSTFEFKRSYK